MLRIHDFDGEVVATTPEEVERRLATRYEKDLNAFVVFPTERDFPVVSLLVKGPLAFLTYTAKEDEAGYVSDGGRIGLPPGEQSMFYITPNEPQWVANESIIPSSDAVEAVKELLLSPELPRSIRWFEL